MLEASFPEGSAYFFQLDGISLFQRSHERFADVPRRATLGWRDLFYELADVVGAAHASQPRWSAILRRFFPIGDIRAYRNHCGWRYGAERCAQTHLPSDAARSRVGVTDRRGLMGRFAEAC